MICKRLVPQRDLCYEDRCAYLNMESLEVRRKRAVAITSANILNYAINSSELLSQFQLRVPRASSRNQQILKESTKKTNFAQKDPITRLTKSLNEFQDKFDFHLTKDQFKSKLKNL